MLYNIVVKIIGFISGESDILVVDFSSSASTELYFQIVFGPLE